jgi:serine/threonine protein kinase
MLTRGVIKESDAKHIMFRILSALAYCHDKEIWHRDVKLENIFLLSDDIRDAVLGDFGLAIGMSSGVFDGQFPGSPQYAAPEIWTRSGRPMVEFLLLLG